VSVAETAASAVYAALKQRREIAFIDVREEAVYATGHPLFAASLPIGRIELEIYDRVPRRSTEVVCYDDGGGEAVSAVGLLESLGYSQASVLLGGLQAWVEAGLQLFSDVNVPSKAFGELVDATLHPPSIDPVELLSRIERGDDLVVLDARRFDEYQVMSIPSAVSVPGGELVRRLASLVDHDETLVVVNCAGRTRSIIGAQSLRNANVANEVVALRNGTIGWSIAGLELDHGADRHFSKSSRTDGRARESARGLAVAAGVRRISWAERDELVAREATTYCFDVRDPAEFEAGHRRGFRPAPGGQLIQETDFFAPVRGATIILSDDDGVRADMAGCPSSIQPIARAKKRSGRGSLRCRRVRRPAQSPSSRLRSVSKMMISSFSISPRARATEQATCRGRASCCDPNSSSGSANFHLAASFSPALTGCLPSSPQPR
jgi:rhodanese-related sulfurtransferase